MPHIENESMPEMEVREFGKPQELANILLHAIGVLFGLMATPLLISKSAVKDNDAGVVSICIYSACFIWLFTASTIYHLTVKRPLKRLFKKLDRISIYFMIAGTYTPILWHYLHNSTGIALLCILWALVLAGTLFELFFPDRFNIFSVISYLIMGLIFVFVPRAFFAALPSSVTALVIAGVVCYCTGVIFYLWQKWSYHHALWHGLVLAGGVCHYVAVLQSVS